MPSWKVWIANLVRADHDVPNAWNVILLVGKQGVEANGDRPHPVIQPPMLGHHRAVNGIVGNNEQTCVNESPTQNGEHMIQIPRDMNVRSSRDQKDEATEPQAKQG